MIAIAVDDEILMLGALVAAIKASPDISEVSQFSGCDEALAFVKENAVDVEILKANTAVSISSISLVGIKNVFCVKPYAVIEGEKVYADTITASYAEWLVSKKDGNKYNAEINAKKIQPQANFLPVSKNAKLINASKGTNA